MPLSPPVKSEIFTLLALLTLSLVVLLVIRHYLRLRSTPAYLIVPVFLAIWLPVGIILLVPIDLASSNLTLVPGHGDDAAADPAVHGIWLPERLLLVWWRITYWLTFVLTWLILPLLAEYADSGYREPRGKLLYSIRSNATYNAVAFGSAFLFLIYVFVSSGVSFEHFKGMLMALSYCWSLVLAIYLLGHGLVSIPRRLLWYGSISGRLRRLAASAPRVYERMEDALIDLEDVEEHVLELERRSKVGSAREYTDWIDELVDMVSLPESRPRNSFLQPLSPGGGRTNLRRVPTVITERYLAELTRRLVRARHTKSRFEHEWHHLLQEYNDTQCILNSEPTRSLVFGNSGPSSSSLWDRFSPLSPYTRYLLHYHVLPVISMGMGGMLAVASALILWSELVKSVLPSASVIRYTVVHHWTGEDNVEVGFGGQVIAALWLTYISAAALTSITEVKVWRGRALVRRNTAHESALWYSMQVAKLSVPLSWNFMTFLSPTVYKKTRFYNFMGYLIDLTPLGQWFDYLFPMLIMIPVAATLFGLYGKVKTYLGFGDIVDDNESGGNSSGYGTGSWREGRALIERELSGNNSSRYSARRAITAGANARAGRVAPTPTTTLGSRAAAPDNTSSGPARPNSNNHNNPRVSGAATTFAGMPSIASQQSSRYAAATRFRDADDNVDDDHDNEDDEGNFFSLIGHRIQNTFETLDTPRWLQELGEGIRRPRWMVGDDDDDDDDDGGRGGGGGGLRGGGGGGEDGDGFGFVGDLRRLF